MGKNIQEDPDIDRPLRWMEVNLRAALLQSMNIHADWAARPRAAVAAGKTAICIDLVTHLDSIKLRQNGLRKGATMIAHTVRVGTRRMLVGEDRRSGRGETLSASSSPTAVHLDRSKKPGSRRGSPCIATGRGAISTNWSRGARRRRC